MFCESLIDTSLTLLSNAVKFKYHKKYQIIFEANVHVNNCQFTSTHKIEKGIFLQIHQYKNSKSI